MDANVRIKTLRGPHDIAMVPDIVKLVADCNILFLEFIDTAKAKAAYTTFANNLTLADRFTPELYAELDLAHAPDAYQRLIWRLRKKNVLVNLVDDTFSDTIKNPLDELQNNMIIDMDVLEHFLQTGDCNATYTLADERTSAAAKDIRRRDKLVATQVTKTIHILQNANLPIRAALVQGYMHHSQPYLENLLPQATIEEYFYNEALMNKMQEDPNLQLITHKLRAPRSRVSHELVDKALIVLGGYLAYELSLPEDRTKNDATVPTATDARTSTWLIGMHKTIRKLKEMSVQEVHSRALGMREELKALLGLQM